MPWLGFFDEEARSRCWWPTPKELKDWERRWFSTPVPEQFTDPSLETPWVFGSIIEAFRNGEYDLLGCRRVSATTERLEFDPHAWPYGGTGCMQALEPVFEEQNEEGEPMPPREHLSQTFVVPRQPAKPTQPAQRPFHHPAPWQEYEALPFSSSVPTRRLPCVRATVPAVSTATRT